MTTGSTGQSQFSYSTEHQGHSVKSKGIGEEVDELRSETAKAIAAQFSQSQLWAQLAYGGAGDTLDETRQLLKYI